MLLLVGLGNPHPDNKNNRHNIGFAVIDSINKQYGLSKQKPKFKGLLTTGKIHDHKVFAVKPLTFMNNSGVCIKELVDYFKIDVGNVIVFHDDIDINLGKIRTKRGGSDAGHNGIESIDKYIGKEYTRVRIGIGISEEETVSTHVLANFSENEQNIITKITKDIVSSLLILMNKQLDLFSSKVNQT